MTSGEAERDPVEALAAGSSPIRLEVPTEPRISMYTEVEASPSRKTTCAAGTTRFMTTGARSPS